MKDIELKKKKQKWEAEDANERKLREEYADMNYIDMSSNDVKKALQLYIETGDLVHAARRYKIPYTELNTLRIKANIPLIV